MAAQRRSKSDRHDERSIAPRLLQGSATQEYPRFGCLPSDQCQPPRDEVAGATDPTGDDPIGLDISRV